MKEPAGCNGRAIAPAQQVSGMMKELVELTRKLGLNEYEAKAYIALSQMGSAQVAGISRSSGIPRARVYDVLVSLEQKGFVVKKPSKPLQYEALNARTALQNLVERKRRLFDQHLEELAGISTVLEKKLVPASGAIASQDGVWLVEGRDNIYDKIAQRFGNAKESVIISSSCGGIRKKNDAFFQKLGTLAKRGVKVNRRKTRARFIVFDRSAVVLFLTPDSAGSENEKALVIESPFVASYFGSVARK